MRKPLLSVCVITYNHARYIKDAIDSILMQKTDFDWELVIADDYSTDGTREIIEDYRNKFPDKIKLILQKKNFGPEKNWLDLMAYPKSKYVLYTEGDDYMIDSNKLQKQVDFMEAHRDFSVCFHPVKVVYEDGSRTDEIFPTPELRFNKKILGVKDLLKHNFIQTNSAVYRWRFTKEDIKKTFPKNIIPGDWFLHLLHAQTGKIGFIDEAMSVYRRHAGGLWWAAHSDRGELWRKYSVPHMQAYYELLKIFGEDPECRKTIYDSINHVFDEVLDIKEDSGKDLLHTLLQKFPDAGESFIMAHKKTIESKNAKISELHRVIDDRDKKYKKLSDEFHASKVALVEAENELKNIKNSRAYKLFDKTSLARKAARHVRHPRS